MKKLYISVFFILLAALAYSQNGYNTTAGAKGLGMAGAILGYQNIDAAFGNQAGLAFLSRFSAVAVAQRRLSLNELSSLGAAAAYPTQSGTFALQVQYFGFDNFNEQKIGLAYARKLGEKFALGGQISFLNTRIPQYGNSGLPVFELGIQSQIVRNLQASAHLINPIAVQITEGEDLPTILRIGLTYKPSQKLEITAQADKDVDLPARFRAGIDYSINSAFGLRVGAATHPAQVSFGFGLNLENGLGLDVASSYHAQLGFIPGVGFKYEL